MNKFLFITHVTPSAKRSSLRAALFECYKKALKQQKYNNWSVMLIDEETKNEDNFFHFHIDQSGTRENTIEQLERLYERQDVMELVKSHNYIVKLDDDDIISSTVLNECSDTDADVVFDEMHTFYDISSGSITQQKRPWMASTCIHKTEHAMAVLNAGKNFNFYTNSIFYADHSQAWHTYYKDKKSVAVKPENPVYLRVLSPTSITAGSGGNLNDLNKYYNYLKTFGYWKKAGVNGFDELMQDLSSAWEQAAGRKQSKINGVSFMNRLADRLKR